MSIRLYPCLWFDNQARDAAAFYCSILENSRITSDTPPVVTVELNGHRFMLLNGGPRFKPNPSISFFITCSTEEELREKWARLSEGGTVMMPVNNYPWAPLYGWCMDRYGVNWQLMTGGTMGEKMIVPALMFTMGNSGKAEEAITLYTSVFPGSSVKALHRYQPGEYDVVGYIKHGQFFLGNQLFVAMDSSGPHPFTFSEGVSLVAECDTQEEIDACWNALTAGGGEESRCGWLKDPYGVSWQVIPAQLGVWMQHAETAQRIMPLLLGMNKIDTGALENAVNNG